MSLITKIVLVVAVFTACYAFLRLFERALDVLTDGER